MSWMNNDGLFIEYGTEKAVANTGGEYRFDGPRHCIEVDIDLTKLTVTNGGTILSDTTFFPKNARIEEVDVLVLTAATGSTAVLNVGLVKTDRTTEIDFNGFVAALPQTSLSAAGDMVKLNVGSTDAGALIGTVTTNSGYLTADYDTAAFTAGKVRVRIFYSMG